MPLCLKIRFLLKVGAALGIEVLVATVNQVDGANKLHRVNILYLYSLMSCPDH
jgi:hypothetical protein